MPSVTITLTDTPAGGVAVHSNYVPALGQKTSMAQSAAQDIINRTCKEYGLPNPVRAVAPMLRDGIDIDAVHRSCDNVINNPTNTREIAKQLAALELGPEQGR